MRQHLLNSTLNPTSRSPSPEPLTHAQEQAALRAETIQAFHTIPGDDEEDDILVPREKTKDELEQEEEEYRDFLKRQVGEDIENLITIEKTGDLPNVIEEKVDADEAASPKKKRKKEKRKDESDHEFLMKYVFLNCQKLHLDSFNL